MAFGVGSTGFVLKRFEDISVEITADLKAAFGEIDTDPEAVFGQIIGIVSRHLAEVWEQAQNIYNAHPSAAEGVVLDDACSYVAVSRLGASKSTVVAELRGTDTTVVPAATTLSQSILAAQFVTLAEATISVGAAHRAVISFSTVEDDTDYTVTIAGNAVVFNSGTGATADSIAAGLMAAINADSDVNVLVLASHVASSGLLVVETIDYTLDGAFAVAVDGNMALDEIWSPVAVEASVAGASPVPEGSIDTIVAPVSGLDEVSNFVAGITGRNIETDAEFRIRRRQSVSAAAAGTLSAMTTKLKQDVAEIAQLFIYENNGDAVDVYGRPGHSFEVLVNAPDTSEVNQAIAEKIWELKPAGIATYGTTTMTVVDSNEQNQAVSFSHTVAKYAHIKLACSRTGADQAFPVGGDVLIKNEVLRLGALLTFGSDLLVQIFAAAGYVAGGITAVTASVAVTNAPGDSPSWQTTNLAIGQTAYPEFALDRVTVEIS